MMQYHFLQNAVALCALGTNCAAQDHFDTAAQAAAVSLLVAA